MNIRFANAFDTIPSAVQGVPKALKRANGRTWAIIGLVILALVALGVWWMASAPVKKEPLPPVMVATAQAQDVTVAEHALGTVVANAMVQVTARVTGQLMTASFKEGDLVHAGQLLFQIDPRPFQAALAQARAALAKDQASLVSAQNDWKRYETLFKAGAASQQQRDQAEATAKGFVATVQADRAAIEVAALNLGYAQIRSPIDGKTGPILVQPGNMVTAGGGSSTTSSSSSTTTTAGTTTSGNSGGSSSNTLVVITQIQPVKVSFSLPQSDLPRIQARAHQGALTASIDFHQKGLTPLEAPVDFVSNAVSATTGTIELRSTFANADSALVPGQLVDINVALDTLKSAIVVPRQAVNIGPESRYVYIVDAKGNAELRNVNVLFDAGATMALSGQIKAGDKVITDGQIRVIPDKPVQVVTPHGAPHAGAPKA
jgi:membrane fusion protein, multidrug efflux system